MKRLDEAQRIYDWIVAQVRKCLSQHADVQGDSGELRTAGGTEAEMKRRDTLRLKHQFDKVWRVAWNQLLGDGDEKQYQYMNVEGERRLDEIRNSYRSMVTAEYERAMAAWLDPPARKRVMRERSHYGQVQRIPI